MSYESNEKVTCGIGSPKVKSIETKQVTLKSVDHWMRMRQYYSEIPNGWLTRSEFEKRKIDDGDNFE